MEIEKEVNINTKENSLTSRLFKRYHVEKKDELQLYFSLPCANEKTEPLEWWKINEPQFPKLACIARDYLAIPATSVPAEQSFSLSKNLITERRNRMLSKTVRECICLKSWWQGPLKNSY